MSSYQELCTLFYDADKPHPSADELQFYADLCRQSIGPIHEAMCGSGRLLLPLAKMGFDIDGSDASPSMLAACMQKCDRTIQTYLQSLSNLSLPRQYGLIYIPSESFSLITDLHEVEQSFERVYRHLMPSGRFYCEVKRKTNQESCSWPWGGRWLDLPDGQKLIISWMGRYDAVTRISHSLNRYELIDSNGSLMKTELETFDLRSYQKDEVKALLERIGFKIISLIETEGRLTILCGK